ncbi:DUF2512 family protein [Virgibacillus ainsalahensis]
MNHFKLFAVKFIASLILLYLILGLGFGMEFVNVFWVTLTLSVLAYLGDLFILPRISNVFATISDFVLAFVVIYFMSYGVTAGGDWFAASLIAAAGNTVCEYFYHIYIMANREGQRNWDPTKRMLNVETEAAEETHPFDSDQRKK